MVSGNILCYARNLRDSPSARADLTIFVLMGVLAACGLIYEYLISHYSARVLGSIETVIYTVIGIMIISMGAGAFLSKKIDDAFLAFAWIEVGIAFLGTVSIVLIAATTAIAEILPVALTKAFNIPPGLIIKSGFFSTVESIVGTLPYWIALVLGLLVGMEIPLMARIRQSMHEEHLTHNAGEIYGADYIGAGLGAFLWVTVLISMPIAYSAILVASVNVVAGLFFIFNFRKYIAGHIPVLFLAHIIVVMSMLVVNKNIRDWSWSFENMLYPGELMISSDTKFQHVAITKQGTNSSGNPGFCLFINGHTQMCSSDEKIYHSHLVYPAMLAAESRGSVLIIGGGDGLALRDVFRWGDDVKSVVLADLDPGMTDLFSQPMVDLYSGFSNGPLIELTDRSYSDPRLELRHGDAYQTVRDLAREGRKFDVVIVDLPDPSHPDLNKLYSVRFYKRIRYLMKKDGVVVVQSTSPYRAKDLFLTTGLTLEGAGFSHVEQYHANVPTFSEWGWTIGVLNNDSVTARLKRKSQRDIVVDDGWMTYELMLAAFAFPRGYFDRRNEMEPNTMGSGIAYNLHIKAWKSKQGEIGSL